MALDLEHIKVANDLGKQKLAWHYHCVFNREWQEITGNSNTNLANLRIMLVAVSAMG